MVLQWTKDDPEKLRFLSSLIPLYLECQEKKVPLKHNFYPNVLKDYVEKWPVKPVQDDIARYGEAEAKAMAEKTLLQASVDTKASRHVANVEHFRESPRGFPTTHVLGRRPVFRYHPRLLHRLSNLTRVLQWR